MRNREPHPGFVTLAVAVWILIGGAGCSDRAEDSPLVNARSTPEALAEAALQALVAEDAEGLDELKITREEYEKLLWPILPDREYVPFDFVWSVTGPRSRKARDEALSDFGGRSLELVGVSLGDEIERYDEFTLYREPQMTVRFPATGDQGFLPLMGALIEMGGGWKFMNFKEDH